MENLNHVFGFKEQTMEMELVSNILHARVEIGNYMMNANGYLINVLQMDLLA